MYLHLNEEEIKKFTEQIEEGYKQPNKSYLYYEKNITLIDDTEFDQMCKTLLEKYDEVEHMHKHLVKKENLTAGTGYDIKYTEMIKDSAMKLQRVWR